VADFSEVTVDAPLNPLLYITGRQLFGWPVYLLIINTGHDIHVKQAEDRGYNRDGSAKHNGLSDGVNHFNPRSPLFEARDTRYIVLSDIGLLFAASILFWGCIYIWYSKFGTVVLFAISLGQPLAW